MYFILLFFFLILLIRLFFNSFSKRMIVRLFQDHSVLVCGEKGSGKDLLFSYVIYRRKFHYLSNINYGGLYHDFVPIRDFNCGGNTSDSLILDSVSPYEYPYPDGYDYYISDGGVYFPSSENSLLNKRYRSFPLFAALSRHLGDCRIHANVQSPNRLWDKLREQMTVYIRLRKSRVFFGRFVRMKLTVYDRYESCLDKIQPIKKRWGRIGKIEFEKARASYGSIINKTIYFCIHHKYDDRRFKALLRGDKSNLEVIEK